MGDSDRWQLHGKEKMGDSDGWQLHGQGCKTWGAPQLSPVVCSEWLGTKAVGGRSRCGRSRAPYAGPLLGFRTPAMWFRDQEVGLGRGAPLLLCKPRRNTHPAFITSLCCLFGKAW